MHKYKKKLKIKIERIFKKMNLKLKKKFYQDKLRFSIYSN
jgi:hypothetical protein